MKNEKQEHGRFILAKGKGIASMMNKCKAKNLTSYNSVLVIKDTSDLDSAWYVYNLPGTDGIYAKQVFHNKKKVC